MRRGEIWWGEGAPPVGSRPFVVVSRDLLNDIRDTVMVSPVTTRIRGVPTEVALGETEGLDRPSVANMNTLMMLPKARLGRRVGACSVVKLSAIDAALRWALDLG